MFKKANSNTNANANATKSAAPVKQGKTRELIPTIVTPDVHLLGNMVSEGSIDFSGTIDGNIRCDILTLREQGVVKGEITANAVHIQGTVKGLIRAKNVHLQASCKVEGIIIHEQLSIEDGAFVDGKCKRADRVKEVVEEDEAESEEGTIEAMATTAPRSANTAKMLENIRLIR